MSGRVALAVDRGAVLVLAQAACLGVVWLWPAPALWSLPTSVMAGCWVLLGTALLVGLSGAGALGRVLRVHPRPAKRAELRTGGIYRYVRHPIYLAVLLASTSEAVRSARPEPVLGLLALAVVLHVKADYEESLLRATFGEAYDVYASRVPRIVPVLPRVVPRARPRTIDRG